MYETTQQPAALAEETSAASVAMNKRSQDMSQRLAFFTLDEKWSQPAKPASSQAGASSPSTAFAEPKMVVVEQTAAATARQEKTAVAVTAAQWDDEDWEEF